VARIACLHLLDSVSGELPKRFLSDELDSSWIRTEIVARAGLEVHLRISGRTRAHAPARAISTSPNCVETCLLGYATFNVASQSFDRFEMVALGQCTEFQRPAGKTSTEPKEIGFAFTLATPEQPKTPPFFVHRYDADWLTRGEAPGSSSVASRAGDP
jgi:hypothetical protein